MPGLKGGETMATGYVFKQAHDYSKQQGSANSLMKISNGLAKAQAEAQAKKDLKKKSMK